MEQLAFCSPLVFFIDLIGPMSIFSPLAFFSFAALRGDLRRYLCINHRSLLLRFSELPLNQLTDLDICFFSPSSHPPCALTTAQLDTFTPPIRQPRPRVALLLTARCAVQTSIGRY